MTQLRHKQGIDIICVVNRTVLQNN